MHKHNNKINKRNSSIIKNKVFSQNIAGSIVSAFFALLLSQSALAEISQSGAWQCQAKENGNWNCLVSEGPLAPKSEPVKIDKSKNSSYNEASKTAASTNNSPSVKKAALIEDSKSSKGSLPADGSTPQSKAITINNPIQNSAPIIAGQAICDVQSAKKHPYNTLNAESAETTVIEADEAVSPDKEKIDFSGNVIINKNSQALNADQASYNKITKTFNAQGNVVIAQPGMVLKGDSASYQTELNKGQIGNAVYQLPQRPAQGIADSISFIPGEMTMQNPTYSSCPAGDEDWQISAAEMELHQDGGYGEAKHAVMRFKGVPIAYTPYISFPLNDDRKSGFLMPDIGISDKNGFELATPYYFNIAPDQDATVTPRILSDRGLMLGGEYRYLKENHSGEIYAEWLNDSSYNDKRDVADVAVREGIAGIETADPNGKIKPREIAKNRGAFSLQQRANWRNGWSGNVNYNYVSDSYYLDDFGNNLRDKSTTHLLRNGQLNYNGKLFNFMARTQGYQELEDSAHTYSRLPQLTLDANETFTGYGINLDAGFDSEFVMFAQNWDDDQDVRVEASRLHIKPSVSIPYENSYAFITPKFSLDMVTYKLKNEDTDPHGSVNWDNDSPSRVAPVFSLDSGLFFDRELSLFDLPMQQTLEPRLFYLYTPDKDQADIPLFDTGMSTFSFNQLFRENRFTGVDRLGDANQLSAALTTRFIDDESGAERFSASIGQIYYFEDRNVTLDYDNNGQAIQRSNGADTNSSSSIAAEITSHFAPHWYTSYSLLYNPNENSSTEESRYRLQYKSDRDHIANFDYSYRAQDYEQVEMSAYWKLAGQWRALAHWYYSIYDHRVSDDNVDIAIDKSRDSYTLDSKIGVEYDSCCYALRFIIGREQDNYYSEANNYVMLQVQFKGLGSLSQALAGSGHNLEQDIPGFEPWKN